MFLSSQGKGLMEGICFLSSKGKRLREGMFPLFSEGRDLGRDMFSLFSLVNSDLVKGNFTSRITAAVSKHNIYLRCRYNALSSLLLVYFLSSRKVSR